MQSNLIENNQEIEAKCVNTIRALAIDAVAKANSGHSGTPMALAPIAHVLFSRILRFDPKNPDWYNRDRFVLSAGHASMLLYASLYLNGYDISLDDIKDFRQWDSKTPGHPEVHHTPGVEVTTGPLGQGFANAVGMAIAEEILRNKLGKEYVDHNIFVLCSDGDLMEGISYEAASLAGHNKLSKLIAIYDDNKITIDGKTDLTFSEDVGKRFEAQGWNVIRAGEISEDLDKIESAINTAKQNDDGPTIIIVQSHIGFPSPKFTDTSAAHGALTDAQDNSQAKEIMGFSSEFEVSQDVLDFYKEANSRNEGLSEITAQQISLNNEFADIVNGTNSAFVDLTNKELESYFSNEDGTSSAPGSGDSIATRVSCSQILSTISKNYESLVGGSADLTGNTGTKISGFESFSERSKKGKQIYFGIREHSMAAIANAMALSYNLRPFVGTFFVFADYMRPSIRLAAITKAPVLFVFSHDSIGVGEDGPTHQPIEQLASLRAMPGLEVIRPCDGFETAAAIEQHLKNASGPTALILTRQNIPTLENTSKLARSGVQKGAYEIGTAKNAQAVLVSSGSEVHLCTQAQSQLKDSGLEVRVISMPNMKRAIELNESDRNELFGIDIPVISVEAGASFGWSEFSDHHIGVDRFGASAPAADVFSNLGITTNAIVELVNKLVSK